MNLKQNQQGISKMIIIIIIAVVLALVGTGAALFFAGVFDSGAPAASQAAAEENTEAAGETPAEGEAEGAAAAKQPNFLPIEPPIIVNFDKNGRAGYLQVTVQLMSYDTAVLENAIKNMPIIRNNLLLLFSAKKYDDVKDVAGKEALRREVLNEVNNILVQSTGKGGLENVYFTSFVMQ